MTMTASACDATALATATCLFRSLGDPSRSAILTHLMVGEHRVVDLTEHLGLAQSTVSEHLRILKDAGIVTGTIDYPRICYALDSTALAPIRDLIEAIAARPPESEAACCFTPQGCVPKETVT